MKTTTIYIKALFLMVIMFGCSDEFLDRPPIDKIVSTNFYRTQEDAQQALIAVYDVIQYQSVGEWAPYGTIQDILSDDSFAGGGDSGDGANEDELNTFNIPSNNLIVHSIWQRNYIGIYRANLLLERLPDISATDEFKTRVEAECKFLRAYFYFEQVKYFENIPLLTSTIKSTTEFAQTQNTPKEVYDLIATDLVFAINNLSGDLTGDELGRANKWASEALMARVFLFYNGMYNSDMDAADGTTIDRTKALEYLEDIISNSSHALLANYDDIFHIPAEWGSESVFEIGYGEMPAGWWDWNWTVGGEGNLGAQMQGPRVTGSDLYDRGWSFAPVSEKLYQDMSTDPRLASTILTEQDLIDDPKGSYTRGYQHTGYYNKKYSSDAEHWATDGQFELNRTVNFRVIRYSDVLLMAAELGSPSALLYIKMVRDRAYFPNPDPTPVLNATLDAIYNERRLEFALEGIRYFDVIRRGMTYAEQELTVVGVSGQYYLEDQVVFDVTFNPATRGFLPIPQAEIDLSEGRFKQNAGY